MTSELIDVNALTAQIEKALSRPDVLDSIRSDPNRRELCEAARKLNLSLESGGDSVHRITNSVGFFTS